MVWRFGWLCDGQVGEDLISADSVDSLRSAAPGAGLFKPVDFCFQVGPIFNFVSGKISQPCWNIAPHNLKVSHPSETLKQFFLAALRWNYTAAMTYYDVTPILKHFP